MRYIIRRIVEFNLSSIILECYDAILIGVTVLVKCFLRDPLTKSPLATLWTRS